MRSRLCALALVASCSGGARPLLAHHVDPPMAARISIAPRLQLVEHDMPELIALPPLVMRPAAPARDDTVTRDCLALVARFDGFRRDLEPHLLRAAVNHAIAIGGDCRLSADHVFGERAARLERWGCGGRVYDEAYSAWQIAAAVATTPERRSAALRNRAMLMWNHAAQVTTGAMHVWIATAGAFERAAVAAPGDPHLGSLAVDAWDNAIRTIHRSRAGAADLRAIRSGLAHSRGPRAAHLLATLPR
jgi:hypothetical protein